MSRIATTALVLLAALGVARAARAQAEPSAQIAQSLFDDGRTLMDAHRYAEACPKFAESQRLDPGGGTLLNLALCHELEGRTASAWTEFRDALSLAIRDQRKDRKDLAEQHIMALAPKLVRLTVFVPEAIAQSAPDITLDRARLPDAAWNTAIPVDPGEHRLVVSAAGRPPWEGVVSTTEPGRTYSIEVALRESVAGAPEPPPPPAPIVAEVPVASSAPTTTQRSTAFWIVLGAGGVALATSVVTGVLALNANAYVNDNCSSERSFCRVDDAQETADRARTLAWVSTATLVAAAGAGVAALLLPRESAPSPSPSLRAATGNGAVLRW